MARRSDIDWEGVEKDYRAGILTIFQIADKFNVSDSQVRLKAKNNGWQRNLTAAIHERTKAKIAQIDVAELVEQSAHESAGKSAALIKSAVEQASDALAGLTLKHRATLRQQIERAHEMQERIDSMMAEAADQKELVPLVGAFKNAVDAIVKLIDMERKVTGLDKGGEEDKEGALRALLRAHAPQQ